MYICTWNYDLKVHLKPLRPAHFIPLQPAHRFRYLHLKRKMQEYCTKTGIAKLTIRSTSINVEVEKNNADKMSHVSAKLHFGT